MTLEDFVRDRGAAWNELDALIGDARRRPARLGAARVRRLGALYRATVADLAFARRRFPGETVTARLEERVGRARNLVYQAPGRRESVVAWITREYWQAVRARWREVALAAALMFGAAGIAGVWADRDPGAAGGLAPGAYESVTQPRPHGANLELPTSERTALASEIFTNNIRVTLIAFVAGLAAGLGTALLLIYNGALLGVVGGLAVSSGNGSIFFQLVTAHGVLELSCITVAGAAALRMGWTLVEPGRRTRPQALGAEAREAIKIVLGTAPWLVVAGLIEGLLTPAGLGLPAVVAIGFGVASIYWLLVLTLGRARTTPVTSPAGTP